LKGEGNAAGGESSPENRCKEKADNEHRPATRKNAVRRASTRLGKLGMKDQRTPALVGSPKNRDTQLFLSQCARWLLLRSDYRSPTHTKRVLCVWIAQVPQCLATNIPPPPRATVTIIQVSIAAAAPTAVRLHLLEIQRARIVRKSGR
jgi:hypothetical protein